jgi:hypothetical protein
MNLANRLQHLYEWTPNYRLVFKKPVPPELKTFRVPQSTGKQGWIVLTYNEKVPTCIWISNGESEVLPCIVDERICGDTFLRVEKLDDRKYLVSDIWMYNSNCVFACSTFKQRYDWLKELLSTFTRHIEGVTIQLIHKSDFNGTIKGYEEYPEEIIGKPGYYVEDTVQDFETVTVTRMSIPDCYEIAGKGYLRVPDIKTSLYLRSKGETFKCKCSKYDDEFWDIMENIPEVE